MCYNKLECLKNERMLDMAKKILIETSARHVHVSAADLEILFGKGHKLTNKKDLSQPGQFACEEKVTVKGSTSLI